MLYLIAVVLAIFWIISVLGFNTGGLIHILLVVAIISVVLGMIRGNNSN